VKGHISNWPDFYIGLDRTKALLSTLSFFFFLVYIMYNKKFNNTSKLIGHLNKQILLLLLLPNDGLKFARSEPALR
jgi:hypothetical protein